MKVEADYLPLVRINAPEFYRDPQFVAWLNDLQRQQATWHRKGEQPGEFSDLFFTVDPPDGSDSDMPEHLWRQILAAVGQADECVVWLSNLTEKEEP
jgi:hypothetical protein